jgi:hypothetical protein
VKSHELLTDKEVGELWAKAQVPALESSLVIKLIRKLVEERAWGKKGRKIFTPHQQDVFLNDALRDFGIDPATFLGGKT